MIIKSGINDGILDGPVDLFSSELIYVKFLLIRYVSKYKIYLIRIFFF